MMLKYKAQTDFPVAAEEVAGFVFKKMWCDFTW